MAQRYLYRITPGNFGRYDSELNTSSFGDNGNFDLTITLKVHLLPKNEGRKVITDGDGNRFLISNWPREAWRQFCEKYQRTGQEFWDGKFWLRTPANYLGFDYDAGDSRLEQIEIPRFESVETCTAYIFCSTELRPYRETVTVRRGLLRRPNLNCRFRLELATTAGSAHTTISAYYITHRRSRNRWIRIRPGESTTFRSDSETYSSSDLEEEIMDFEGHQLTFRTHLHEIAHAIGLEHSGVARRELSCMLMIAISQFDVNAEGANHALCYGTTLESASDVAGMGMALSWHDALPWRYAAQQHTGISMHDWQVEQRAIRDGTIPFHS